MHTNWSTTTEGIGGDGPIKLKSFGAEVLLEPTEKNFIDGMLEIGSCKNKSSIEDSTNGISPGQSSERSKKEDSTAKESITKRAESERRRSWNNLMLNFKKYIYLI